MALVLLYNISGEKLTRIKGALLRLGIPCREVTPEEYGLPLGRLAEGGGFAPGRTPAPAEFFREEMLVMCALEPRRFSALLETLRASGAAVALKAVLTEHNAGWDSAELHRALRQEHETMRALVKKKR